MIGIYTRVSTGKQDNKVQEVDIDRWLDENPTDKILVAYEDVVSGNKIRRPEYERLKADVEAGEITTVVAYKIDRLGRRAIDLVDDMIWFYRQGVDVIFTSQPNLSLKHDDPFSLTKIAIFAELSQIERNHISVRTKLGLVKAKEKDPSLGKKKDLKKRTKIIKLKAKGLSCRAIAKKLKCSHRLIQSALKEA